ncbi:MAG: hypothetical protein FJ404_17730 [Verrucomicrobia bacterium]|nr:hypothetical protein [Verrucomicrobiota bacterium]
MRDRSSDFSASRVRLPLPGSLRISLCLAAGLICSTLGARPVTLDDLRREPKLTPQRFASYFSEFRYQFFEEVQLPEMFLATELGDCDDYATLAAEILSQRGFRPHLIAVRMPGLVHVVCYVDEIGGYLDYNSRVYLKRTVSCDKDLRSIANKVARSFGAHWTSASEFAFVHRLKHLVSTITHANPSASVSSIPPRSTSDPSLTPLPLR